MLLRRVVIDELTWRSAPELRRHEWRLAIDELLDEHAFEHDPVEVDLEIELGKHRTILRFLRDGEAVATGHVDHATMRAHVDDYVAICKKMGALDQGSGSAKVEALDMAKKLAHDAAARTLASMLDGVKPDLRTSRRLFTLLLTLYVDTSRLAMVHAHKRPYREKGSG